MMKRRPHLFLNPGAERFKGSISFAAIVGRVLATYRTKKNFSQLVMARCLEISQPAYSHIESGTTIVNVEHLRSFAGWFRTDVSKIMAKAERVARRLYDDDAIFITFGKPPPASALVKAGARVGRAALEDALPIAVRVTPRVIVRTVKGEKIAFVYRNRKTRLVGAATTRR